MKQKTVPKEVSLAPVSFSAGALSPHTARAYSADMGQFLAWCQKHKHSGLPANPAHVALFLRDGIRLGTSLAATRRRLAAISYWHLSNREPSPASAWEVRNTMLRLGKEHGKPAKAKQALSISDLRSMLKKCSQNLTGTRDHAILLLGFCSALKRSELVALHLEDIAVAKEGLVITVRKGKHVSRSIAVPAGKHAETCPLRSLRAWVTAAAITNGPLFRAVNKSGRVGVSPLSDRVIADLVKKYCLLIGKRPKAFSGYSLRSGFAIAATQAGASQSTIRRQTGHSTLEGLRRYTGEAAIFQDHPMLKMDI
ncbi:MAG: tyrosine-type recombinase/integrase [Deltaproteobacteria bacterium]|nr:tyrosine-type recombinase/integrase [Deltaproteobacteria bacterium]